MDAMPDIRAPGDEALASFIGKWQARWPEWAIAASFVPADQRRDTAAWFALLQELTDAAWAGSDATPGLAKLAWWREELHGWAKGARRHPLGEALQRKPAAWSTLADALSGLPATRALDHDPVDALEPLARALGLCERVVLAAGDGRDAGAQALGQPLLRALRAERALLGGDHALARSLVAEAVPDAQAAAARRMHWRFQRQRLARLARGRGATPAPGWQILFAAWRAARR